MPVGTVRYVNADRRFGFISRDDMQPTVFLHVTEVQKAGVDASRRVQRWVFDLEQKRDSSPVAVKLRSEAADAGYLIRCTPGINHLACQFSAVQFLPNLCRTNRRF